MRIARDDRDGLPAAAEGLRPCAKTRLRAESAGRRQIRRGWPQPHQLAAAYKRLHAKAVLEDREHFVFKLRVTGAIVRVKPAVGKGHTASIAVAPLAEHDDHLGVLGALLAKAFWVHP